MDSIKDPIRINEKFFLDLEASVEGMFSSRIVSDKFCAWGFVIRKKYCE